MATERMKKVHRLIAGGMDVEAAMEEAGYGPACIPGLAPQLPSILAEAGLTAKQATTPRAKEDGPAPKRSGKGAAATPGEPTTTGGGDPAPADAADAAA
jgi:hypothetical protein